MSVLTERAAVTATRLPDRVRRHLLIDRIYHWTMAATVLTLIFTALWPTVFQDKTVVMGDPHWIAGIILVALVVAHIVRAIFWQNWRSMVGDRADLENIRRVIATSTGRGGPLPHKAGKYNGLQKLFHLGVAVIIVSLAGTGVLMLFKIGTPSLIPFMIVPKNPYLLSQPNWDIVYALHGLAAAVLVGMVMIHVYFALRPDEWHLTRSMFRGWISRGELERHHDPARWRAND